MRSPFTGLTFVQDRGKLLGLLTLWQVQKIVSFSSTDQALLVRLANNGDGSALYPRESLALPRAYDVRHGFAPTQETVRPGVPEQVYTARSDSSMRCKPTKHSAASLYGPSR